MKIIQDDLWFCEDCFLLFETNGISSFKSEDRIREIEKELSLFEVEGHLVSNNDSETGKGIKEFSWKYCDCCGTGLTGKRYRMALLGRE